MPRKMLLIVALFLSLAGASLAGCSSSTTASGPSIPPPVAVAPSGDVTIIDVRTPDEYSSGHLDNAINYDISSPSFDTEIGALDRNGEYVLYCRSGNRSAQAAEKMKSMGFVDVTDLGSMENASETTGLEVLR